MPSARPADVRTTVVAAALREALARLDRPGGSTAHGPLHVVDAGGGTGGVAVPLAADGHRVTVVDPSPDSLAALERRAAEAGLADRVTAVQGDLDALGRVVPDGGADVVLVHRVLEQVDDPLTALRSVRAALRPGGLASVLAANRLALVVQRAVAGRLAEAALLLDPVPRPGPLAPDELLALVADAGLVPQRVQGVRVVSGLVPGALLDEPGAGPALLRLEEAAADHPDLQRVAAEVHVLAGRPA